MAPFANSPVPKNQNQLPSDPARDVHKYGHYGNTPEAIAPPNVARTPCAWRHASRQQ